MAGMGPGDPSAEPDRPDVQSDRIVFLCDLTGGRARPSSETLAVEFFDFDHLPPLSSNRTNERHLAEVLAHLGDPNRPAMFD